MAVIKHAIAPEGDLEIVLERHSTKKVTPNLILPQLLSDSMYHDQIDEDEDKIDCPKVSAGLPPLQTLGNDSVTSKHIPI